MNILCSLQEGCSVVRYVKDIDILLPLSKTSQKEKKKLNLRVLVNERGGVERGGGTGSECGYGVRIFFSLYTSKLCPAFSFCFFSSLK